MTEMTEARLKDLCKKHELFQTPGANEKLYANCCGFTSLGGLERYTSLKALFIDSNALDSLQGLPPMPDLKCLYAQVNGLYTLEGLEAAPELETLNIDINCLESLEGLEAAPQLGVLYAANNRIDKVEQLAALKGCPRLSTLDLRNNKLDDKEGLVEMLQALPALKCLYLRGNPLVSEFRNYRKTLISALPGLTYLDDRPVFDVERRASEAWARGGLEEERAERERYRVELHKKHADNFDFVRQQRREGWRKRRASLGLPPGDTDPFFELHKSPKSEQEGEGEGTTSGDENANPNEGCHGGCCTQRDENANPNQGCQGGCRPQQDGHCTGQPPTNDAAPLPPLPERGTAQLPPLPETMPQLPPEEAVMFKARCLC